ncbi:tetratricopeptide repeat protein [Nocardiopsis sp. RSe5-2]|uniref:non-specific serine/threonine protein kinase n=1 Tax=Nocardiopsis endophytica TaxID=3018445 RepID=A0ABT4U0A5_9ACTN|nr:serine/threonine-protein kinase [Nocardiopsis endophytica]MDA2810383.1 tetratricopeptide repeat protein [Nocardiopsis endophytica]
MNQCTDPACGGAVEDGFCSVCGLAPAPTPEPARSPTPSPTPSPSHPSPRGVSAPSGRVSRRSGSSRRGMLGLGMVQVPPVPYRDPATAVMADPAVAEKNRFCGGCGEKVGRSRNGRPGRTEGYCPSCGTEYSFVPKLRKGDLVAGQYEVLGCLAHGGLGWIYLARDHNVSDRWVVLKGLLNSGDAEAHKTAAAERSFLAEVEHPNIVKIYNFVQHPDPGTGVPAGHIVMEYVGGKSLRDLIAERRRRDGEASGLPVSQVIAYALEVLRALGYLHGKGLLYCDFKPDNVIQSEEQIKLIDLGGVRRAEDALTPVYTTPGYRVPERELRELGPTVSSDLYTVGRTMAVLSCRFSFGKRHPHTLPDPAEAPVLAEYESYRRFLERATHIEPDARFHDAADMSEQLTGVLREVLSKDEGGPHPGPSALFGPERFLARAAGAAASADPDLLLRRPEPAETVAVLPTPLVDPADPAAGLLGGLSAVRPEELAATLRAAPSPSPETRLMLARALILAGRGEEAGTVLEEFESQMPGDWRTYWYLALRALGAGDVDGARERFDELYSHLPGEAAPKLGLAAALEAAGRPGEAEERLEAVWRTDRTYVSAAFALARIRLGRGERGAAVDVLDSVPELSSLHVAAQTAAVGAQIGGRPADLSAAELVAAGARLERAAGQGAATHRLRARVLEAALERLLDGGAPEPGTELLGAPMDEQGLRGNLERTYRALARTALDPDRRRAFVDRANARRVRTWT